MRRVMGENGLLAPIASGVTKRRRTTEPSSPTRSMKCGNGHEPDRHPRGRAGLCFRRRRTRELRNHRHSRRAFSQRFEALEPVRQGVHRCFGSIAPGVARGLKLRHDHGSNYMSGDFQDEINCLGIEASPSFVREPEGNGVAERFIRTLKENLLWVRTFKMLIPKEAAPQFRDDVAPHNGMMPPPDSEMIAPPITE